jgi:F-type H+-transporting ATPase subunit gamma
VATARETKKRIRSVKNISQITRALEAVSASKVRRAQMRVMASRAFAEKAWEILLNVQAAGQAGPAMHPLLEERSEIKNILMVVIASDQGLAGAFNTNILRVAQRFEERLGKPVRYIAVGRRSRDTLIRAGKNVIAEFSDLPAEPTIADISPISRLAIDQFLSGEVDDVFIAYTDFINKLTQRPVVLGWLPLVPHTIDDQVASEYVKDVPNVTSGSMNYEYEPDPEAILQEIVPRFTELQLYQAVLESQASEHSARMVAMRNASENAAQLTDALTVIYNKARQAAITSEILDIVGGTEALQAEMDKVVDQLLAADTNGNGAAKRKTAAPAAKRAGEADDLTRIEGIGPKMAAALVEAGITTYVQLSQASEDVLTQAIEAAGLRFAPSLPTWAEQAGFLARGDEQGLEALQERLVAGRRE